MKKIIALTLALLTVLSVSTVCAAATNQTEKAKTVPTEATEAAAQTDAKSKTTAKADTKDASSIAKRSDVEKKSIYADRNSTVSPVTADTVTIDGENSVFTVVTASGTELSITVPFGAYCITQDIYQQLDIYLSLYADVGAALKKYVNNGIHMDLYNFYTGQSVYVAEADDTFAAMMGELKKLNISERKQVAEYMSKYWYGNYSAKIKTVGGNPYIAFDLAEDCGFVVYNTIVGGKLIEIYTICDSGKDGMEVIDGMIASLRFGSGVPSPEEEPAPEPTETTPEETQPVEALPEETLSQETEAT